MRNLALELSYNGARYHGWQVQKNALSVQEVVQDAVEKVFGRRENVTGCSRTDTGVHANQYYFHMHTVSAIKPGRIVAALNQYLPYDIAVLSCREVPLDFHARYHVIGKEYIYKIHNSRVRDPFLHNLCLEYRFLLDAGYLNETAQHFVGTHDFKAFCSVKSDVADTVRTISRAEVRRDGDFIIFMFYGDGFLYNMVRIMVGTLIQTAQGKYSPEDIPLMLLSKDRKQAGKTAAACGLYLNRVDYADGWFEPGL